jgi:hypothetical protein
VEVTLAYTYSGTTYSQAFDLLALKGMDEPDSLKRNAVVHEYLDGSMEEQIDGFFKSPITLSFNPTNSAYRRRFLVNWLIAERKWVVYGTYISEGVTDVELISQWIADIEHGRTFQVNLYDTHKYYDWQDEPAEADDLMYLKRNVKITGTSTSPQTFTTGTAPLDNPMDNTENWPAFSSTTHVPHVILTPTNDCQFVPCLVGLSTIVAGNVTFQAFVADMQVPSADGFFYVDVMIMLQAKP